MGTVGTPLDLALATADDRRSYVRRLFATIAARYDVITVLLSGGRDAAWKRRLVGDAAIGPDERVLDLATGTGDLAFLSGVHTRHVVGLDVTLGMIVRAEAKARARGGGTVGPPCFLVGDMMTLPFDADTFEVVTTGYGLRNVPQLGPALGEILRVLRPGGRFWSLDFERPESAWLRRTYLAYLWAVGGALGWALHGDADTYRYIPASIRRYAGARGVARQMADVGFVDVGWTHLCGGLMAVHHARRPVR